MSYNILLYTSNEPEPIPGVLEKLSSVVFVENKDAFFTFAGTVNDTDNQQRYCYQQVAGAVITAINSKDIPDETH